VSDATNGVGSGAPALELRDVESGYTDNVVLHDVSIEVPKGKVVALLGPNGAGKSTMLKTAAGLISPIRGSVVLDGTDVTKRRANQRSRSGLCYVPEGRAVYRSLTVRENLVMQAKRGQERAAVERTLEAFPALSDRLRQIAGSLSGGEQQMVAMASAYVREPKVLLVDEPSLGLAPLIVDRIFEFLQTVASTGTALLVVDQYIHRALDMADRAYVLSRGQISYSGAAADLDADEVFARYLS
jgi:branched-chain amino acid transport system ATP-binding protein